MSKRVCHLTSAHQCTDVRIFVKQCRSLAKAGYETFLIAPDCEDHAVEGVQIISAGPKEPSRRKRMTLTVKEVLKKALEVDADIYHFHDPELLRIAKKLKARNKKVIYDVHEDLPRQIKSKYWINKSLRSTVSFGIEKYENKVSAKLDHIVTATPAIEARFLQINPNTTAINNYPLLSELRLEGSWDKKAREVCYIGGMTQIRGGVELVAAMNETQNVQLNFAGPISPETFSNHIQTLPGWNKVNYLGTIDRKGVADILGRSMAGIVTFLPMPNHIDAQPNKMFEYMSAEIPVIGSHFPLWKEILEQNECGLCIDPENPKALAAAIQQLVDNPERAQQMGKNGRAAVERIYNWEVEELKLLGIYRTLLK